MDIYSVRIADWHDQGGALRAVREAVFIREQGVPVELEWDEFDFSAQPTRYAPYGAGGAAARDTFGMGLDYSQPVYGGEYLMKVRTRAPDGTVHDGAAHVEEGSGRGIGRREQQAG